MIRADESNIHEDGDGRDLFGLMDLSQEQIDADWEQYSERHIDPSRLFQLSFGIIEETEQDRHHLEWCDCCRGVYEGYLCPADDTTERRAERENQIGEYRQQKLLWSTGAVVETNGERTPTGSAKPNGQPIQSVPDELRDHLHVEGPVLFPGEEVAFESWQFGRLMEIRRDDPALEKRLVDAIATRVEADLLHRVDERNLLLVCFGRPMHRCGTRIAARFADRGFRNPHVVLAHDFYSPTFVCNPKEFHEADVIVLVDVVHTGGMLDRLMSACLEFVPQRVRGLALVDQSEGSLLCSEWNGIWTELREDRLSLNQFLREATSEEKRLLRRFEPNDACARAKNTEAKCGASNDLSVSVDLQLLQHIHVTGALKRDHVIGNRRYPYVVNVLDLLGKDSRARDFVLDRSVSELSDLRDAKACLAYHAGRARRAGKIAKLLSARLGWPSIPVGTKGPTFALTDVQFRRLACHEAVVLVDAAVRTGDSISAMADAVNDEWFRKHTDVLAFCVLDSLSSLSLSDLSASVGINIRTLFKLPLAPPSEDIGHWTNSQKAAIRKKIHESGAFASVEQALGGYFDPPRRRIESDSGAARSLDETKALVEGAIAHAQAANFGAKEIGRACHESKSSVIRHLTVDEVVHDDRVQDLLLGVMYNSMSPSFKESAALGLAAAGNYDWMELEWLKCNRSFLASRGNSWKSIPLIECEMRLTNHTSELARFRKAAMEFRGSFIEKRSEHGESQQLLLESDVRPQDSSKTRKGNVESRVRERLDVIIKAAG